MKKYFYLLLAAALFVGCSEDDENGVNDTDTEVSDGSELTQPSAEWDYTSCLGMNLMQALGKFGDTPAFDMGTMKMYEYEDGKVELVMLTFNDNEQLYSISASLTENAVTADELKAYFGGRYTLIDENSGTYTWDDEDEEGTGDAEEVAYCYLTYADNADVTLATVTVNIMVEDASATIIYMNPQLVPAEEEGPGTIAMNAFELVDEFMGQDIDELLDEYDGYIISYPNAYVAEIDDDYVSSVVIGTENGIVAQLMFYYDESLEDEDIIDYYEANGYQIITLEPEIVDGVRIPVYEFRNTEKGISIRYSDGEAIVTAL